MSQANAVVTVDEELWFGSLGDDKELEDRAAKSMAAVAARVLGAKPFPAAARKLEELTRSAATRIEQVVGVLESDPGLSMRLLRLVNSAGYALRVRCTSVRHAASLVGMRRLHQLATTAAVLDLFETDNPAIKSLLNHAAVVGAFCRYLAVHVDLAPDELFTCGFLHDIGKLMLIDAEGAPYLELVERAGESPDALYLLEQETYGFDHAVLGAHVLKNWRIPNPVPRVVAWHHNVARAYQADPAIAAMVQALRLADQLSYLVRTHAEAEGILVAAQSPAASYLGVSEAQLSSMWADLVRLSQRINQPGAADTSEIIPREESIRPSARPKGKKSRAPKSVPPPSIAPEVASARLSEMPKHFVCVVCSKASFGSRCPVCSGHVCSQHQVGVEQWCTECAAAYSLDVGNNGFPVWERFTAIGIVVGAGLLSLLVAVLAGRPIVGALMGSVLLSSLCVLLVLIGRRFWMKRSFLRTRAQSSAGDDAMLPLGLSMPPEPAISMFSDMGDSILGNSFRPATANRPTERINPVPKSAGLPALFSVSPSDASRRSSAPSASVAPPSIPAPPSVPAIVPGVLSPHTGTARASMPTARIGRAPSVVPATVHSAAPPATEAGPPTQIQKGSDLPDAPGWRPVERTEPAMPASKSAPSELRRLAEALPSIPPPADLPAGVEHPSMHAGPEHAPSAPEHAAPEQASLPPVEPPTSSSVRTSMEAPPRAPTLASFTDPAAAAPAVAPSVEAPPPAVAAVSVAAPEPVAVEASAPVAAPPVEAPSSPEASAPVAASSPEASAPDTADSPPLAASPTSEISTAAGMSVAPVVMAAACQAVEPSLQVACRPASLKPMHYACSPSAR